MSNEITILSDEIIKQYQGISTKPISFDEFISIRKQAISELDAGYVTHSVPQVKPAVVTNERKPNNNVTKEHTLVPAKEVQLETIKTDSEDDLFFALCDSID